MSEAFDNAVPVGRPRDDADRLERHEALASLLAAFVDGELPPETTSQIEAHLLGCTRCRREVTVHRSVAAGLGQVRGPVASAAFHTRLRQAVAAAPVAPAALAASAPARPIETRRALWRPLFVAVAVLTLVAVGAPLLRWTAAQRDGTPAPGDVRAGAAGSGVATTVQLSSTVGLFDSLAQHYRETAVRDLPGRARDLEVVRRAVGVPVTPLPSSSAELVGAWTSTLDGELVGVLAYRWRDRLLVQYLVPDALVFRSAAVRAALAQGRPVGAEQEALTLLGWVQPHGMAVLVAPASRRELASLSPVVP
ncbi:zf-HC2 domain-containing protein [Gemmatimonas sp.]|uniref:zf-HC2 domain-containing protein n=1 Tax=Gemmatimonas sp. TaxID=1962908 RepID=UPI00334005CD